MLTPTQLENLFVKQYRPQFAYAQKKYGTQLDKEVIHDQVIDSFIYISRTFNPTMGTQMATLLMTTIDNRCRYKLKVEKDKFHFGRSIPLKRKGQVIGKIKTISVDRLVDNEQDNAGLVNILLKDTSEQPFIENKTIMDFYNYTLRTGGSLKDYGKYDFGYVINEENEIIPTKTKIDLDDTAKQLLKKLKKEILEYGNQLRDERSIG